MHRNVVGTCKALAVVCLLVVPCVAHAYLLDSHWGVTLTLGPGSTDIYQGLTTYPINPSSFAPTLNTTTTRYVVGDWHGYWSTTSMGDYQTLSGDHPAGAEPYDVEALYLDYDATNVYVAIITSFPPPPGRIEGRLLDEPLVVTGDLALNLGLGDPAPDGFRYNYGVNINHEVRPTDPGYDAESGGTTIGNEVYKTSNSDWYLGTPSLAVPGTGELTNFDPNYIGFGGQYKGTATVNYYQYSFGDNQETLHPTYVIEATIPFSLLDGFEPGKPMGVSWSEGCRNDSDDSRAILRLNIPEPGTFALAGVGLLGLWMLRRRKGAG